MDALSVVSLLALQAMSILLLPHNIPDSLKHLSTMVDDIWYYAGDRSTDVSGFFDPTRYLLALVCSSTGISSAFLLGQLVHTAGGTDGDL